MALPYSLELPLCDAESEKSKLESTLLKSQILSHQDHKSEVKEAVIKLFGVRLTM